VKEYLQEELYQRMWDNAESHLADWDACRWIELNGVRCLSPHPVTVGTLAHTYPELFVAKMDSFTLVGWHYKQPTLWMQPNERGCLGLRSLHGKHEPRWIRSPTVLQTTYDAVSDAAEKEGWEGEVRVASPTLWLLNHHHLETSRGLVEEVNKFFVKKKT